MKLRAGKTQFKLLKCELCIVSVVSVLKKVNFRIMVSSQHWKGYIH